MLREIFLGIFNRSLSCKDPEYQRPFLYQLNCASGNGLQFRSIWGEHKHFTFMHRFFPAEAIETMVHGYRKSLEIFPPTAQPSEKKNKKGFLFLNLSIKQGKMGTET